MDAYGQGLSCYFTLAAQGFFARLLQADPTLVLFSKPPFEGDELDIYGLAMESAYRTIFLRRS